MRVWWPVFFCSGFICARLLAFELKTVDFHPIAADNKICFSLLVISILALLFSFHFDGVLFVESWLDKT